jgi:hypothetical protein
VKVLIEMTIPDNMDTSALLELAQEFALDLYEDYPDQDDEGEDIELDDDAKEAVRNEVSVQEAKSPDCTACRSEGSVVTMCCKCTAYQ